MGASCLLCSALSGVVGVYYVGASCLLCSALSGVVGVYYVGASCLLCSALSGGALCGGILITLFSIKWGIMWGHPVYFVQR